MKTDSQERSPWLSAVDLSCAVCQGTGWRSEGSVCLCAWRGVWRDVYRRFRECAERGSYKPIFLDGTPGPQGRRSGYGIRHVEFMADFCLIAQRTLNALDYKVFKFHYLYGADWKLCCSQLGTSRGYFFGRAYAIQEQLGRVFATLEPYALWPLDEYFSGSTRRVDIRPRPIPAARYTNGIPIRAPLGQRLPQAPLAPPPPAFPCELLVPVAPFDIHDEADVARWARKGFRAGRGMCWLAAELTRFKTPAQNGGDWRQCDVKHLLLCHPRAPAPAKAA